MADVTIVIPAYNAARTIGRTVASLKAQTIPVEIVVVDDGSREPLVLDGVRVIRQENRGGYAARMLGVRLSKTKFVGFVDADDEVEPDMYERMLALANKYDLDVVQCGTWNQCIERDNEILKSRQEVLSRYVCPVLVEGHGAACVWDKLYKREVCFERVQFIDTKMVMFDDLILNCQAFEHVNSMGLLHKGLYHYNVNEGSVVRNFRIQYIHDLKEAARIRNVCLPKYGVNPNSPVMSRWVRLNFRNYLISASCAPCDSWRTRLDNVQNLFISFWGKAPCGLPLIVFMIRIFRHALKKIRG